MQLSNRCNFALQTSLTKNCIPSTTQFLNNLGTDVNDMVAKIGLASEIS